MRLILGIALGLWGAALLLQQYDRPAADAAAETPWVRTVDGWEPGGDWSSSVAGPPRVHPLVVAAGQALGSLLALAACTQAGRRLASRRSLGRSIARRRPLAAARR